MNTEIKQYQLNGESVWQGSLCKINGRKENKPVHFYIRPLNVNDAPAMGELSENIYNNLRSGEECFIHKHSKEYFYDVFNDTKTKYIGVFIGTHLIGMSYLKICENRAELQEELPNASYDFFQKGRNGNKTRVASLGADSVLPAYRGNSLNAIMINYRLNQAENLGCTDCTSIVDRNNRWNMTPYFACRFNLFATAIDPSDGGKISLLHKPLGQDTVLSCFKSRISLPYDRLELIDGLLKKGFIGVEFDKNKAEVSFAHSSYYVATLNQPKKIYNICAKKEYFAI